MKPKDLKPFFNFEERKPLLENHIFNVPFYYTDYSSYMLPSFSEYFKNENPVSIEYCSGNGDWIIEKAQSHPEKNWIAVEKRFDRVRKIWSKLKNNRISNLLIVYGEAFTFTRHYLQDAEIEAVYINFPDPWPKFKHAKNRLLQFNFLNELARILKVGKEVTFVTDDFSYLNESIKHFSSHTHFSPILPAPYYKCDLSNYGNSWFESLWREKGKQIFYTQFCKIS